MKKVLFLHGLESRPGGKKPSYLVNKGYYVFNPHLPKSSFSDSVDIAQAIIDTESPDVIVGSSRGGAIAMCVDPKECKLVLIAPAWTRFKQSQQADAFLSADAMVIHSRNDNVVDFSDSERLAATSGAKLIAAGICHRMSDADALEALADAIRWVTRP